MIKNKILVECLDFLGSLFPFFVDIGCLLVLQEHSFCAPLDQKSTHSIILNHTLSISPNDIFYLKVYFDHSGNTHAFLKVYMVMRVNKIDLKKKSSCTALQVTKRCHVGNDGKIL